jgi:hypothetical protein
MQGSEGVRGQGREGRKGFINKASSSSSSAATVLDLLPPTLLFSPSSFFLSSLSCRGQAVQPFAGIWPELSLINHNCQPNCISIPVGEKMVVR